jgi:hypothetical protein
MEKVMLDSIVNGKRCSYPILERLPRLSTAALLND